MVSPRTLLREGCAIHFLHERRGPGPVLLFLHGAGTDHRSLLPQMEALPRETSFLAWDARGHGRSRPKGAPLTVDRLLDDLVALLDAEGIDAVVPVGHSLGGNLAQLLARRAPARVPAMVLLEATVNHVPLSWLERALFGLTPALLRLYPARALAEQSARQTSRRPAVQAYLRECFTALGPEDLKEITLRALDALRPDPAYRFGRPVLYLIGADNRAGNIRRVAPLFAAQEPRAELHVIQGAGHMVGMDAPEEVNRLLLAFLARLGAATAAAGR